MALEHHFVVVVREDGTMDIDGEVSLNFDSGSVWDTTNETWLDYTEEDVYEANEQAFERLYAVLNPQIGGN